MNRHYVLRLQNVVHVKQLSSGRVTGDVNLSVALVNHIGAKLGEPINDSVNSVLVSRNQRAGQNDSVAFDNFDVVLQIHHARKYRHRLTLATGGHEHYLAGVKTECVFQFN